MAIKDIFKVSRKTFFYPSAWIGYNEVKTNSQFIWGIIRGLVAQPAAGKAETYEQALQRLNLTDAETQQTAQTYLLYALIFLLLGIFSFVFGFYLLIYHHTFAGFVEGLAVAGLFLAQAFSYHFWFFQVRHRKLGCTFQEWLRGKVNKDQETKS